MENIVIICFGSPRLAGDALGPMVGSRLVDAGVPCFVYGTLRRPVTAKNMENYLSFIAAAHEGATLLAVDASLGPADKLWKISVRRDGVCPAAVGGRKKRVGEVGILAVVGDSKEEHLNALITANGDKVSETADKVAFLIVSAIGGEHEKRCEI